MSDLVQERLDDLISKVSLGDRRAFSELYDLVSPKLLGVSLRLLRDRATAEDVLQETFMKIWRYAGQYTRNGMHPMAWLVTIARNTAIDRLRKTRDVDDLADWEDRLTDHAPSPEQVAVAKSEAHQIYLCLDELKTDRAKAVRWAYLEGFSYSEISENLDVPLNTIRTWLRRSLISLQECMAR